ncbi:MAG: hypothetical protein ACOX36_06610 [Saccharofermentanales bacterium]|jgi:hypothetical protein
MRHRLKIGIGQSEKSNGIVRYRKVTVRERLLRLLFGKAEEVTVIIPGNTVKTIAIQEE